MKNSTVTRALSVPDRARVSRYERAPELGPQVLFFSGGTALTEISRELKSLTHNSIHLVTPFDSGGSSAKLRDAFAMPAIGDLRARLMALADESVLGHPEVVRLFSYRLPKDAAPDALRKELDAMVSGKDAWIAAIKNPMRRLICNNLGFFRKAMPKSFDLRGASIGNLILAGGYLNNHKQLDPILFLFARLVGVKGTVGTIVNDDLHLGVELADGTHVIGQHRITGKEEAPLTQPIAKLFISAAPHKADPVRPSVQKNKRKLISGADMICFPPGSFYSSILANLLPKGVGAAIAANPNPKVYLPSLGTDPERPDLSLAGTVDKLLATLRADAGRDCPTDKLLNFVLLDTRNGAYDIAPSRRALKKLGVEVIDTPLADPKSKTKYDPKLASIALMSLT